MKRVTVWTLAVVLLMSGCVWAEVAVSVGGAGSGDITVEEIFRTEFGVIYEYLEAVDSTYVFQKHVATWTDEDDRGFDEFKYIDVKGEFEFVERVWAFDPVLDHFELGAFTGFGGEGRIEFEKYVTVAYAYDVLDGWLDQELYVGGYFAEGYVFVDHVMHEISHTASQDFEFHMWSNSGVEHVWQTATAGPGEENVFGVTVDFFTQGFRLESEIYDFGW